MYEQICMRLCGIPDDKLILTINNIVDEFNGCIENCYLKLMLKVN